MEAALDWFARTHGPQRVFCMIDPANDRSIALAMKLGFEAHGDGELPDGASREAQAAASEAATNTAYSKTSEMPSLV